MRLTVIAIAAACVVAGGPGLAASSASAPLGVSVTVARWCAVQAGAIDATSTVLRLECPSAHAANVLVGSQQLTAPRGLFRVAEMEESSSGLTTVRVVTLNF